MIDVQGLSKRFADTVALDGLSFSVQRGEVVGLLGPNGAGKTTCMRVLACFVPPGEGQVRIAGLDVQRCSVAARRQLGYLPEGVPLYPELRVDEYLQFRARLRRLPRAAARAAIASVVERCGLGEVRRRIVGQLSRGYRQRLGLADALLGDPPLLVLDEPTVGLDPNQIREARALIRALGSDHTVLLSTHILSEVEAVCSRVLILHRGRLVADRPVEGLRGAAEGAGAWLLQARPASDPPDGQQLLAVLLAVAGVTAVQLIGDAPLRCRIEAEGGAGAGERIAAALHEAGWALQELRRETTALEDVFARLTSDGTRGAR